MHSIARTRLWLIPLLVIAGIASVFVYGYRTRDTDARFHAPLADTLSVTSGAFVEGGVIPARYTCRGAGLSPDLAWDNAPAGTRSYALLVTDWDLPIPQLRISHYVHWALFNMPAEMVQLPEQVPNDALLARGLVIGNNSAGAAGYEPPCPPSGSHTYRFRVYALDVETISPRGTGLFDIMEAMDTHVLAYGELSAYVGAGEAEP